MQDSSIQQRISELVDEEHRLRSAVQAGRIDSDEERTRLGHLEEQLDQCWDLLRRRRAARSNHGDPEGVQARSVDEVEHYQQ
jgi:septation ring formation regulator EzrA